MVERRATYGLNSMLGPRWVFPAYWLAFLGATLVFHPGSLLDWDAAAMILGGCGMVALGATAATALINERIMPSVQEAPRSARGSRLRWAIAIGATANILAAVVALGGNLSQALRAVSIDSLAAATNELAVERYEGVASPTVTFLLLGVGYVSALVSPFIRLTDSSRPTLWTLLPAATSLAYATVTSARLGFLVAAALTVGGVIAVSVLRHRRAPQLRLRAVVSVVLIGVLSAGAFVGIGVLRTGQVNAVALQATLAKQTAYSVGTVGAFSYWYERYQSQPLPQPGMGTATVAGVEYLTGQERNATRAYGEFAYIDESGRRSNVYTAFRGLILDFGVPGSLLFLWIAGFVLGRLYLGAVRGSAVAASLLGFAYANVFFSAWLATTTFTNVLAVAFAAPVVLQWAGLTDVSRMQVLVKGTRAPAARRRHLNQRLAGRTDGGLLERLG